LPSDAKLVRGLSLTDSILLLAGGIIGSGIFLTAKDVAVNTRHPWLFLTVWVVGMGMVVGKLRANSHLDPLNGLHGQHSKLLIKDVSVPYDFEVSSWGDLVISAANDLDSSLLSYLFGAVILGLAINTLAALLGR